MIIKITPKVLWLFLIILVIGAGLRLYSLDSESFWYDEAVSVKLSSCEASSIFKGEAKDFGNPPMYPLALHYWMKIFGSNEIAVRSLSAFFGIISLFLIFRISLILFDWRVALISLSFFTFSPLHIYYSQEARVYSLLTLLALLSFLFFIHILKNHSNKSFFPYGISIFLGLLSHYFFVFIVIAQIVFLIVYWRKYRLKIWKYIGVLLAVAILYSIIWMPSLIDHVMTEGNLKRSESTWYFHFLATPIFYSVGRCLIWKDSSHLSMLVFTSLIAIGFGYPFFVGVFHSKQNKERSVLILLWLVIPLLMPFLISILFSPLYASMYSIAGTPAYYIFLGKGIVEIKKKHISCVCIFIIAVIYLISLANLYGNHQKFEWKQAAKYVEENSHKNEIVLFDAGFFETAFSFYYQGNLPRFSLTKDAAQKSERMIFGTRKGLGSNESRSIDIAKCQKIWLVLCNNHIFGAGDYYRKKLIELIGNEILENKFKGITIYSYLKKKDQN
jgi:mannosyltransferase